MAGGSYSRESASDVQCRNCGLWFDRAGVQSHIDNCDHPEDVSPIVDIETDSASNDDLRDDLEADDFQEKTDDADQEPEDLAEVAVSSDPTPATDGGVQTLPTPATDGGRDPDESTEVDVDVVDDVQEETDDTAACPECGSTRVYPVDELPEWVLEAVPEIEEHSHVCDSETSIRHGRVEAFDA